jgi:hypothetical protein
LLFVWFDDTSLALSQSHEVCVDIHFRLIERISSRRANAFQKGAIEVSKGMMKRKQGKVCTDAG